MKFRITTQHADYEKSFGGPSIEVDGDADGLVISACEIPERIGEPIDISAHGDIAEQLSAMYGGAEVEIIG